MRLKELLTQSGYICPKEYEKIEITGVSSNSKRVGRGEVFVALRGLRDDGFRHLDEAISRGAAFVVAEREATGVPNLTVKDARLALSQLLDAWHAHPAAKMKLIGITGTNGKTSTAAMLFAILQKNGNRCGLVGTVESRLGDRLLSAKGGDALANMTTPEPEQLFELLSQMRDGGAEYVVMEVTSHALFFSRVAPLFFKRAIFTNLSSEHLDLHGDMEEYFCEKRKLFSRCEAAVISCRTPYGERLADSLDVPVFRIDGESVTEIKKRGARGVAFTLRHPIHEKLRIDLPIPGEFSVENAALAASTALSLGVPANVVQEALSGFGGVKGRMERVGEGKNGVSVFVDYAHTPDALEKLLLTVRDFCGKDQRITVLFGCGGDRDRTKRPEMGRIASRLADRVILSADNSRSERTEDILADILKGIDKEKPYTVIPDRKTAIRHALETARAGEILLLTGKGHEEYEIKGGVRLPFSEREIVAEFFDEVGGVGT